MRNFYTLSCHEYHEDPNLSGWHGFTFLVRDPKYVPSIARRMCDFIHGRYCPIEIREHEILFGTDDSLQLSVSEKGQCYLRGNLDLVQTMAYAIHLIFPPPTVLTEMDGSVYWDARTRIMNNEPIVDPLFDVDYKMYW